MRMLLWLKYNTTILSVAIALTRMMIANTIALIYLSLHI